MQELFKTRCLLRHLGFSIPFFLSSFLVPFSNSYASYVPLVDVVVTAGDHPDEIFWELRDLDGNIVLSGGAPFFQTLEIEAANYDLTMYDSVGDSWNGAYISFNSHISQASWAVMSIFQVSDPENPVPQVVTTTISVFWPTPFNDCDGSENFTDQFDFSIYDYAYQTAAMTSDCCGEWSTFCQEYYEFLDSLFFFGATIHDDIPEITPAAVFNDSRLFADLNDGEDEDSLNCAVADMGQKYLWFRFTANRTNSLVSARREIGGNFNGVIEVYENLDDPPIVCQDNSNSANEVAVFSTDIGKVYFIRVYHNGATVLTNTTISVAAAFVPTTELSAADCGRMNLTDADIIRSNWPPNQFLLANWMFEFKELEAPYNTYHVISPNGSNPQFRWFWFPQREPGRTYEVRTRPRMYQGPTWADWGASCVIGTAPAAPGQPAGLVQSSGSSASASNEIGIQLWPNPAQNEVNISFRPAANDQVADISIFDISGKEVDRLQYGFDRGVFQNIVYTNEKLDAGIYLFHIRTESGTSVARLVVTK